MLLRDVPVLRRYEANMLMRLQHPNMVRFFGLTRGTHDKRRHRSTAGLGQVCVCACAGCGIPSAARLLLPCARPVDCALNAVLRTAACLFFSLRSLAHLTCMFARACVTPQAELGADQFESTSTEFSMNMSEEDEDAPAPPLFIVTEYCSGGNIRQLVERHAGEL